MKKKIIILSYYFPPFNNMASRRWAQMIPYLEKEYDLYVFTLNSEGDLLVPLEESKILRVGFLENKNHSRGSMKKQSFIGKQISHLRKDLRTIDSTLKSFYLDFREDFKSFFKDVNPDIVVTSLGPFSGAYYGNFAKKINPEVVWVTDLRDPMGFYSLKKRSSFKKYIDEVIDRYFLKKSDIIFAATKVYAKQFSAIYRKKVSVLYNGYEEIPKLGSKQPGSKRVIFFPGQVYDYMFEGLRILLESISAVDDIQLKIRLVATHEQHQKILELVNSFASASVEILEPTTSAQIQMEYQETDYLLLLEDLDPMNKSGTIPGKLFEYLPYNCPILAIARKGSEIEEILDQTSRGVVLSDSNQIIEFLNFSEPLKANNTEIKKYSRSNQARLFADVLTKELQ